MSFRKLASISYRKLMDRRNPTEVEYRDLFSEFQYQLGILNEVLRDLEARGVPTLSTGSPLGPDDRIIFLDHIILAYEIATYRIDADDEEILEMMRSGHYLGSMVAEMILLIRERRGSNISQTLELLAERSPDPTPIALIISKSKKPSNYLRAASRLALRDPESMHLLLRTYIVGGDLKAFVRLLDGIVNSKECALPLAALGEIVWLDDEKMDNLDGLLDNIPRDLSNPEEVRSFIRKTLIVGKKLRRRSLREISLSSKAKELNKVIIFTPDGKPKEFSLGELLESLILSGLDGDKAVMVASEVVDRLDGVMTTKELGDLVYRVLIEMGMANQAEAYRRYVSGRVLIRTKGGSVEEIYFSKLSDIIKNFKS